MYIVISWYSDGSSSFPDVKFITEIDRMLQECIDLSKSQKEVTVYYVSGKNVEKMAGKELSE